MPSSYPVLGGVCGFIIRSNVCPYHISIFFDLKSDGVTNRLHRIVGIILCGLIHRRVAIQVLQKIRSSSPIVIWRCRLGNSHQFRTADTDMCWPDRSWRRMLLHAGDMLFDSAQCKISVVRGWRRWRPLSDHGGGHAYLSMKAQWGGCSFGC